MGYSEYNQRELLRRWADHLERPVDAAKQLVVGANKPAADDECSDGTGCDEVTA